MSYEESETIIARQAEEQVRGLFKDIYGDERGEEMAEAFKMNPEFSGLYQKMLAVNRMQVESLRREDQLRPLLEQYLISRRTNLRDGVWRVTTEFASALRRRINGLLI
jgi:hypothetical protein